ncbi:MAG: hypothetical protein CSA34_06080 [Desulfobulbus propionicus]|nr:MAG: hypothetical protein CSA34_06080 [Desulfobulbus propionicus]
MMRGSKDQHDLEANYAKAVTLHQEGAPAKAVALYRQIVTVVPDADLVWYNLGLALFELQEYAEAVTAFQKAVAGCGQDPDPWFNLGLALSHNGCRLEAVDAYKKALELRPGDPDTLHNLGYCQKEMDDLEAAATTYETLLEIEPNYRSGLNNLAYIQHRLGRYEQAAELYRRLLELEPDHALAGHMLAALEGKNVAAPEGAYIRDLFDHFADHFEEKLVDELEYRVPGIIGRLAKEQRQAYECVLDLGCGTGLTGMVLRPLCRELFGVDLSEKMLEKADAKGIYKELCQADILDFLISSQQRWDLIVAADVFNYIGELTPLLRAVQGRLTTDGLVCITTEYARASSWMLNPTGRYGHGKEYVRQVAGASGLEVVYEEEERLRQEQGAWVRGMVWLLRREHADA